ncbi:MAG: hypothetical protein IKE74_08255 [Mogibacterium sp.]|nr:hypothetical protein [Mogibacterium sp.]
MEKYNGNQKGFIYVSCSPKHQNEVLDRYLKPLAQDGVSFWWADGFDKKEEKILERSKAVLLFLTKDYVKESRLRDTLTAAVRHNKPVLCVYLEDVELDAALSMQTEAQQALFVNKFRNDEEFISELKKAAIFEDAGVSIQQEGAKKKRSLMTAAAVAVAAVLLFALVIRPLMTPKANADTMKALGLQGMSKAELEEIRNIRVIGTDVVEGTAQRIQYTDDGRFIYTFDFDSGEVLNNGITTDRGSISDLSGIEQLTNLTTLQLTGQQIEDASQAYGLEKLHTLILSYNPLRSVEGAEKLPKLRTLDISHTDVTEIPEGLHVKELRADGSGLAKIPDFGGLSSVVLDAGGGTRITDVSNLGTAASYTHLAADCDGVDAAQIRDGLEGIKVGELYVNGIQISSLQELAGVDVAKTLGLAGSTLNSLDGIENFEGIDTLDLKDCGRLTDLSGVNRLNSLKYLTITEDMEELAAAVDDRILVQIVHPEAGQEEEDQAEEDGSNGEEETAPEAGE